MDDKHILARARRGELDAFEELVRRYEKRVYVIALRSSGNPEDAADITQEVFLRAWRSIENFRGDSGFSTWLFRITMNICVDHARHRQAQPQTTTLTTEDDEERPIHDTAPTPEEQLDNRELGRELAAALASVKGARRDQRGAPPHRAAARCFRHELFRDRRNPRDQRRYGKIAACARTHCPAQDFAAKREHSAARSV